MDGTEEAVFATKFYGSMVMSETIKKLVSQKSKGEWDGTVA